ncbi:hypothetical protein V6L77_09365 [Pannonibacter sp. Pt2-lr]
MAPLGARPATHTAILGKANVDDTAAAASREHIADLDPLDAVIDREGDLDEGLLAFRKLGDTAGEFVQRLGHVRLGIEEVVARSARG